VAAACDHKDIGAGWVRGVELELDLIKTHMAQNPVLRVEVGALALPVRSVSREGAWRARVCKAPG